MPTPSTGTLALPILDSEPGPSLVRPADLVSALTGVSLLFFALFVHGIVQWKYVGAAAVEQAGVLGWLAPALVGLLCVVTAAVSVAVRVLRAAARRRSLAPSGAGA